MCYLLDKARKDYNIVKELKRINYEMYLDACCYHIQQAIEKALKCGIELRGERYELTHNISRLYRDFVACGWEEIRDLQLMAGTLTDWEAGSRYKESFFATIEELQTAMELYQILEGKIQHYLEESNKVSEYTEETEHIEETENTVEAEETEHTGERKEQNGGITA